MRARDAGEIVEGAVVMGVGEREGASQERKTNGWTGVLQAGEPGDRSQKVEVLAKHPDSLARLARLATPHGAIPLRLWFAALLLFLALAPVSRAGAAVRLNAPSDAVRAGETFKVSWQNLPTDVREVELELSLDGGRWVRLSPELHVLEGSWRWQVPDIAAENARLRLRCGGEHREEVATVSKAFRIVGGPTLKHRRDFLGEWWPALDDSAPRSATPGLLAVNAPAYSRLDSRVSADLPSSPTLHAPADNGQPLRNTALITATAACTPACCASPAYVPMRN